MCDRPSLGEETAHGRPRPQRAASGRGDRQPARRDGFSRRPVAGGWHTSSPARRHRPHRARQVNRNHRPVIRRQTRPRKRPADNHRPERVSDSPELVSVTCGGISAPFPPFYPATLPSHRRAATNAPLKISPPTAGLSCCPPFDQPSLKAAAAALREFSRSRSRPVRVLPGH